MDALYPRLLVEDFDSAARFWTAALRDLLSIEPVKVLPEAGYANWTARPFSSSTPAATWR
jgi:hypothetical protein